MKIIKIPGINGMGRTNGCEKAPESILNALDDVWSNEQGKIVDRRLAEIYEIKVNNSNIEESLNEIEKKAWKILKDEKCLFLGGDHSISFPILKAFKEESEKDKFLIVFDAHADCMPRMPEPSHEEWLRALVEQGFSARNIILLGLRNVWQSELEFLREKNIRAYWMKNMEDKESICDAIMEMAQGKELYVSIDIDVLDPAFAPGTGFCEPGGMSSRELLYYAHRLAMLNNLKAIDIVEVNPSKDTSGRTSKIAAKILAEFL
jgi:agmatinase